MSGIAANLKSLKASIPEEVKIVAVSKTKPVEDILDAYNAGQRLFGENRVQEILNKKDHVPSDIQWHMIGHLQTNKVKLVLPFVSMIQSVDSVKLLTVINTEAAKVMRVVNCLLEIRIAKEESKSGFSPEELESEFRKGILTSLNNIRICGVMGMATFTTNTQQIRGEFRYLRTTFESIRNKFFMNDQAFRDISMGMSGDYQIAIDEGSTMIRVGSLIFGERTKKLYENG